MGVILVVVHGLLKLREMVSYYLGDSSLPGIHSDISVPMGISLLNVSFPYAEKVLLSFQSFSSLFLYF